MLRTHILQTCGLDWIASVWARVRRGDGGWQTERSLWKLTNGKLREIASLDASILSGVCKKKQRELVMCGNKCAHGGNSPLQTSELERRNRDAFKDVAIGPNSLPTLLNITVWTASLWSTNVLLSVCCACSITCSYWFCVLRFRLQDRKSKYMLLLLMMIPCNGLLNALKGFLWINTGRHLRRGKELLLTGAPETPREHF